MSATVLRTFRCLSRASPALSTVLASAPVAAAPRTFTTTAAVFSGHSRWSKIKHDKGKVDSKRAANFSKISAEISYACRDGGAVSSNLRMNSAVAAAKKG